MKPIKSDPPILLGTHWIAKQGKYAAGQIVCARGFAVVLTCRTLMGEIYYRRPRVVYTYGDGEDSACVSDFLNRFEPCPDAVLERVSQVLAAQSKEEEEPPCH